MRPNSIYVPLPGPTRELLNRLAYAEWRHPKDQAALLITEALRARGILPTTEEPTAPPERGAP